MTNRITAYIQSRLQGWGKLEDYAATLDTEKRRLRGALELAKGKSWPGLARREAEEIIRRLELMELRVQREDRPAFKSYEGMVLLQSIRACISLGHHGLRKNRGLRA